MRALRKDGEEGDLECQIRRQQLRMESGGAVVRASKAIPAGALALASAEVAGAKGIANPTAVNGWTWGGSGLSSDCLPACPCA